MGSTALAEVNWNGRRPASINVDAFPYELEAPRWDGVQLLALSLLGVILCTFATAKLWAASRLGDAASSIILSLVTLSSVVGVITGTWRLLRPDLLKLSNDGLEFRSLWRRRYWRWSQVRNFRLQRGRQPKIVFDIAGPAAADWLAPTSISPNWPISPDRLIKILNTANDRLGSGGAQSASAPGDESSVPEASS